MDLPGHGLSDPAAFARGQVREHARALIEDILDALRLDEVPVIGHSLGGMFALWHVAAGPGRICQVVAIGEPAVALPGVRVRMPLSLLTVRGLGAAVLRSPSPPGVYRRLLAQGMGGADIAAAPDPLIEALRLSARRPGNARTVASLMHAIDRFRRPRPESVLTSAELAAITTPALFILGPDDPYLSIERARPSIDQIHGARLCQMPGGHAPWLADPPPRGRADHHPLTPRTRPAPHPAARRKLASKRTGLTGNNKKGPRTVKAGLEELGSDGEDADGAADQGAGGPGSRPGGRNQDIKNFTRLNPSPPCWSAQQIQGILRHGRATRPPRARSPRHPSVPSPSG